MISMDSMLSEVLFDERDEALRQRDLARQFSERFIERTLEQTLPVAKAYALRLASEKIERAYVG